MSTEIDRMKWNDRNFVAATRAGFVVRRHQVRSLETIQIVYEENWRNFNPMENMEDAAILLYQVNRKQGYLSTSFEFREAAVLETIKIFAHEGEHE